eukprot:scaffold449_cov241-Pinguiococcus_pyrenoidosus.AAC.31
MVTWRCGVGAFEVVGGGTCRAGAGGRRRTARSGTGLRMNAPARSGSEGFEGKHLQNSATPARRSDIGCRLRYS